MNTFVNVVFPHHLSVSSLVILKRCGMRSRFTVNLKVGQNNMGRFMEFIKELCLPLLLVILNFFKKFSSNNFLLFMDEELFSQAIELTASFLHGVHIGVGTVMS
jgi:hypothetical protein